MEATSANPSSNEEREKEGGFGNTQKEQGWETRVDLKEGRVRPGLGPQHVGLLDIVKEDIGLVKAMVLMDYLSPYMGPEFAEGVSLTKEEIVMCKKACLSMQVSKKEKRFTNSKKITLLSYPLMMNKKGNNQGALLGWRRKNC